MLNGIVLNSIIIIIETLSYRKSIADKLISSSHGYKLTAKIRSKTKLYGIKPKVNQKPKNINYISNCYEMSLPAGVLYREINNINRSVNHAAYLLLLQYIFP